MIPPLAYLYIPLMLTMQNNGWPDIPDRAFMAAQIQIETCVTLTSQRCWNPRAELKTSREYGFGFGQITVAYDANGKQRFSTFDDLKKVNVDLKGWLWSDRYDPVYQMKALVYMDHSSYERMRQLAGSDDDGLRFMLSAYNGGESNVVQDRLKCILTPGCDPSKWVGNVANTSYKSQAPVSVYGNRSFFQINRDYVHNIMDVQRQKYLVEMDQ